jgi:aryl-alcohol dehydrogenase-like predicted oxidoreductase
MEYTTLGQSDLRVSKVCLGTMTFGQQNSEAEAHQQLDYALARGMNFIDTAELYPVMPSAATQGSTERHIGSWLKKTGRRADVVLATKIAGPNAQLHWIRNGRSNHDAVNIRAAVETSLRRLQTDYIDLYQLHWPSRNVPIFGASVFDPRKERAAVAAAASLEVLGRLVEEGKIRHIGLSNETSWGVSEFVKHASQPGLPRIVSIQNLYNLTARQFETSLLDETCFREQVSLLAYSPLAFGQLTAKYLDDPKAHGRLTIFPATWSPRYLRPGVLSAVAQYAALARAHGMTPTQLALAWCYSRWFVGSTIIGATTLAQLEENIDAFELSLSRELVAAVDAIHAGLPNPGQ